MRYCAGKKRLFHLKEAVQKICLNNWLRVQPHISRSFPSNETHRVSPCGDEGESYINRIAPFTDLPTGITTKVPHTVQKFHVVRCIIILKRYGSASFNFFNKNFCSSLSFMDITPKPKYPFSKQYRGPWRCRGC